MGTFPEDPWAGKRAVTPRGPRVIKTSADDPAAQPGGGMTLDALMLRQKELAGNKAAMPATMGTPMEGVFYALQKGLEGYQQGKAERDVSTGQQAVGNALSSLGPSTSTSVTAPTSLPARSQAMASCASCTRAARSAATSAGTWSANAGDGVPSSGE